MHTLPAMLVSLSFSDPCKLDSCSEMPHSDTESPQRLIQDKPRSLRVAQIVETLHLRLEFSMIHFLRKVCSMSCAWALLKVFLAGGIGGAAATVLHPTTFYLCVVFSSSPLLSGCDKKRACNANSLCVDDRKGVANKNWQEVPRSSLLHRLLLSRSLQDVGECSLFINRHVSLH